MNKEQRTYLINEVKTAHEKQIKILSESIPPKPSLNTYVVAALIEGKLQFKDLEGLKAKLVRKAKTMGAGVQIVKNTSKDYRNTGPVTEYIEIEVEDLVEVPESYRQANNEHAAFKAEAEAKIEALAQNMKSLTLRLTIGSNAILDKMIEEVDAMGEMSLIGETLLLSEGKQDQVKLF